MLATPFVSTRSRPSWYAAFPTIPGLTHPPSRELAGHRVLDDRRADREELSCEGTLRTLLGRSRYSDIEQPPGLRGSHDRRFFVKRRAEGGGLDDRCVGLHHSVVVGLAHRLEDTDSCFGGL